MENKLIIESLKQTINELRDETYTSERTGLAKAGLDFVDMLEQQLILNDVVKPLKEKHTPTFGYWREENCIKFGLTYTYKGKDYNFRELYSKYLNSLKKSL